MRRLVILLLLLVVLTTCVNGKENIKEITLTVKATAYSVECGEWTATGEHVKWGIIAVDPSVIPLGSKVFIEGFDNYFIASDTGGVIKGNRIDIWFPSIEQANNFGVRQLKIKVYKKIM